MKIERNHGSGLLDKTCQWPWRRHLVFAVVLGIFLIVTGCSPSTGDKGYQGISDKHPTGSSNISPENLVAAFDMETITSSGGLLKDFSDHGHHSVLMGTETTTGLFGDALQFKTTGDRIDIPESPAFDIDGPLSIAMWFRIDTLDLHQHLLAADDKFVLWINQDNRLRFTDTRGNGLETKESVDAGRWYSLAAVFDGTSGTQLTQENICLFLDGDVIPGYLIGQAPAIPPIWQPGHLFPSDAVFIGFESHQGEPMHQELPFQGAIDEVLVFSRALNKEEILAHADREL